MGTDNFSGRGKTPSRSLLSLFIFVLTGIITFSCTHGTKKEWQYRHSFVGIRGQRFIDTLGGDLILHGMNLVNKNPELNYLDDQDKKAMSEMHSWGFNCVRLGVIWDGLEPEAGQYSESYLKGIDRRIQWASENNLYVILDMHQDLYSVKFSDGAPEWATLDEGKPHNKGKIWSESYFISPAVQTSFDNFWKNTSASDGTGIQDHLIRGWKLIAQRYQDNPTIIGYDLLNEPFPGSDALKMRELQLQTFQELSGNPGKSVKPEESLKGMLNTEEGRLNVFRILNDIQKFRKVVDTIFPLQREFETGPLMDFYQKARNAIREVDRHHIIFIEHAIFSNSGVPSSISHLLNEEGNQDSLVAYAPHGYDLVTDSKYQSESSFDRLKLIFGRIDSTANRLNMPALVGEWGAFYNNPDSSVFKQTDFIMNQFEAYQFSDTYWSYFENMDKVLYFNALIRP